MDSDGFFGFDTSLPDEDFGLEAERNDDEDFDALNDETFGPGASTGDWEDQHRQLSGLQEDDDSSVKRNALNSSSGKLDNDIFDCATNSSVVASSSLADDLFNSSTLLNNGLGGLALGVAPKTSSFIESMKLDGPDNDLWASSRSGGASVLNSSMKSVLDNTSIDQPYTQLLSTGEDLSNSFSRTAHVEQCNSFQFVDAQIQQLLKLQASNNPLFGYNASQPRPLLESGLMQGSVLPNVDDFSLRLGRPNPQGSVSTQATSQTLPLALATGNVKSVADLEMEMRQQQLKIANHPTEKIVFAEDLERQSTSRSRSFLEDTSGLKPLQPFFTEEQQLQQLQKNQLFEIEQKRISHSHQLPQRAYSNQHYQKTQFHPLTGQPLNTGSLGMNRSPQAMQQQQLLLASLRQQQSRPGLMGHLSPEQQYFMQRYNVLSSQRPNNLNMMAVMMNNKQFGGSRHNNNALLDLNSSGFFDWRGREPSNNGLFHDDRRRQQQWRTEYGIGVASRQRKNSDAPSGRVRHDSEAEWEEWERQREDDEFAGLMTPKQMCWLRNIQIMQLVSDNPYRDDYYYVMYMAKKKQTHPEASLQIQGLEMLLPALPGDVEKDSGSTYQPPAIENSLGKLQVATVNAPRKMLDVHSPGRSDVSCNSSRSSTNRGSSLSEPMPTLVTSPHRLLLLSIEKLFLQFLELEDLERKAAYLPDSPTRDSFLKRSRQLASDLWGVINRRQHDTLAVLSVKKGKTLVANLLQRLDDSVRKHTLRVILENLPLLTRNCQPQHQNTLNILWPVADAILANADVETLLLLASKLSIHLKSTAVENPRVGRDDDSSDKRSVKKVGSDLPCALSSKFGISVTVGLLVRGEQVHKEVVENKLWQEFLSRVIAVFSNTTSSRLTDILVGDSSYSVNALPAIATDTVKSKPASVVVLGRGQSLSSIVKQRNSVSEEDSDDHPTQISVLSLGTHLARCTQHVQSDALAAAQNTLKNLNISPRRTDHSNVSNIGFNRRHLGSL